jgi:UDP-hydrolysing UDP-N-acetyl-D-glucosamine 2-epimerase
VLLVTFHPTTLGAASVAEEIDALLKALDRVEGTLIFTSPVADPGARTILDRIREFTSRKSTSALFPNLGQRVYYSLMTEADLMVGNSSSGIWEAPSFELPVVNVGNRQKGRVRAANVIDTRADRDEILQAVRRGLSADFRNQLHGITNPYGDGAAAPRILSALKTIDLGPELLTKSFEARPLSG